MGILILAVNSTNYFNSSNFHIQTFNNFLGYPNFCQTIRELNGPVWMNVWMGKQQSTVPQSLKTSQSAKSFKQLKLVEPADQNGTVNGPVIKVPGHAVFVTQAKRKLAIR